MAWTHSTVKCRAHSSGANSTKAHYRREGELSLLPGIDKMRTSRLKMIILLGFGMILLQDTLAWSPTLHQRLQTGKRQTLVAEGRNFLAEIQRSDAIRLYQNNIDASMADTPSEQSAADFSEAELTLVANLFAKCKDAADDKNSLETVIMEALPTLQPSLLIKLRQSQYHSSEVVRDVSEHLNAILAARLELAKDTLKELLTAGEIRKLDALIGKAARTGRLDVAFFNVLTMNLQDAMANNNNTEESKASRLQILRHVYTRCQEEVEKTIPPGTALLKKLLRTEQSAIRSNLYSHYLTPQANSITTPDGKVVELKGTQPVLVQLQDFVEAIDTAVLQIRNVESAGGTDKESAAIMVESCRQIAKEARKVVGEKYGRDSEELRLFEEGLQPVFRPSRRSSPYIQGQS